MNTTTPLAPTKKYRITYKTKTVLANVIDYDPASGVLTYDGITLFIFSPDQLRIINNHELLIH